MDKEVLFWKEKKLNLPTKSYYAFFDSTHNINKLNELKKILYANEIEIKPKNINEKYGIYFIKKTKTIHLKNCSLVIDVEADKIKLGGKIYE